VTATSADGTVEEEITTAMIERLDLRYDMSAQQELFGSLSNLDEAIKQLVTYIVEGGLSSFTESSAFILQQDPNFSGNRQIVLFNHEFHDEMNRNYHMPVEALFGKTNTPGLIGYLATEKQIDLMIAEAQRHGIDSQSAEQAKQKRLHEINDLQEYYKKQGILENPRKPIAIDDLSTLGLDLKLAFKTKSAKTLSPDMKETKGAEIYNASLALCDRTLTLEEVLKDLIGILNESIRQTPDFYGTRGSRALDIGNLRGMSKTSIIKLAAYEEINQDQTAWLHMIFEALAEKGHVYRYDRTVVKYNGQLQPQYFIQA
jgi:hypothetical protein